VKLLFEKYEDSGIAIRDEDVDIVTSPAFDNPSRIECDICMAMILDIDIHYHCGMCKDRDFDVCQECIASSAFCLNQSHRLMKRAAIDSTFVQAPD
jgi:hypothetical protein